MLLSTAGLLFFMNVSDAANANISFFLRIGDPPAVIESHPPVPILGGGETEGGRLAYLVQPTTPTPPSDIPPTLSPAEVTINLVSDGAVPDGGSVSRDTAQSAIPQITIVRPTFRGTVGVAGALLFLELHSTTITASFNAGEDGSWDWTPPRDLDPGSHILYITVFDPTGKVKIGSGSLQFDIISPVAKGTSQPTNTQQSRTDVAIPPSLVAQRKVLFDIRVNVLGTTSKSVQPGDSILAQVSLLNIGSPGYIVDALVHYQIINDASNRVLYEESETIGVSTQTSYLKSFSTKSTIPPGKYRLEASVTYGDTEAYSDDQFTISGVPVIATTSHTDMNVSTFVEVLVIVLAIALLIMYTEYHTMDVLQGVLRQVSEKDLKKNGLI